MSLALTLDKIKHKDGVECAAEVINILHNRNFNLALFKEMVKGTEECATWAVPKFHKISLIGARRSLPGHMKDQAELQEQFGVMMKLKCRELKTVS